MAKLTLITMVTMFCITTTNSYYFEEAHQEAAYDYDDIPEEWNDYDGPDGDYEYEYVDAEIQNDGDTGLELYDSVVTTTTAEQPTSDVMSADVLPATTPDDIIAEAKTKCKPATTTTTTTTATTTTTTTTTTKKPTTTTTTTQKVISADLTTPSSPTDIITEAAATCPKTTPATTTTTTTTTTKKPTTTTTTQKLLSANVTAPSSPPDVINEARKLCSVEYYIEKFTCNQSYYQLVSAMSQHSSQSKEECSKQCFLTAQCVGFTYKPGKCYLSKHSRAEYGLRKAGDDYVQCQRKDAKVYLTEFTCEEKAYQLTGYRKIYGMTKEYCAKYCAMEKKCVGFNYSHMDKTICYFSTETLEETPLTHNDVGMSHCQANDDLLSSKGRLMDDEIAKTNLLKYRMERRYFDYMTHFRTYRR